MQRLLYPYPSILSKIDVVLLLDAVAELDLIQFSDGVL